MLKMARTGLALGAGLSALALAACGEEPQLAGDGTGGEARCAEMGDAGKLGATEASASWIAADEEAGLPAFCEVQAFLEPVEGSRIGVVYRLPEGWNGKMLGLGGGGWAGNVTLMAASEGLKKGYATAQTDGGHPGTDVWDNSWAANPPSAEDFAYRAVNHMTVAGKAAVAEYYGREQDRAYFQGCSTGGRMALIEAQRFPGDYDAIISMAPVYSLQVQTSSVMRNNAFAKPGASFSESKLKLVNDAVLAACDADDGVEDGLIADPRACGWKPSALACTTGQDPESCLTPVQVTTLETMYRGVKSPDGQYAQWPMSKGGETLWSMFIGTGGPGQDITKGGGMITLKDQLFGDRDVDYSKLSADKDVPEARSSDFAKMYEATDPNLSEFFAKGGKLLMWHGESDPGPSPDGTIAYVEAVKLAVPELAADGLRYFNVPGVGHCRGGPGPDLIDSLDILDTWMNTGEAPDTIIARKQDSPMTRKLCAWPQVATFNGKGDPNDPDGWSCGPAAGS